MRVKLMDGNRTRWAEILQTSWTLLIGYKYQTSPLHVLQVRFIQIMDKMGSIDILRQ